MDPERFATLTRALAVMLSRRTVAGALALSALGLTSLVEARNKRKKRKRRKKKCGKAGGQPIKGKCCKRSIRVDGRCQRCDVCARGCAFAAVQAAIDAAAAGDTIAICPGTYRGNLRITKDVRLIGAGDGDGANGTIVQGSGIDSAVRIAASVVSLENVRISGGGNSVYGGGIHNDGGSVELISCTVSGNEAGAGGGIFNVGTLSLIASAISENKSGGNGGGIYNAGGTVDLIDCTVSRNTGASNAWGGGIFLGGGTLTLRNSTISENEAGGAGGGIFIFTGTVSLIASAIRENASADRGGGIYNLKSANVTADAASRITANTATSQGGGIYNSAGPVTLASSAIVSGNTPNNCAGVPVANCAG